METRKEIKTLWGHEGAVYSVCFSKYGKKLASGSDDKKIKVWNVESGKEIRNLTGHTFPIS